MNKRSHSIDEAESPAGPSKRAKKYVSRACTVCRRRRTRCDGRPRCHTCEVYGEQCIYDPDSDGRKPASKQHVEALMNRIKILEELLSDRGGDQTPGLSDEEERPKIRRPQQKITLYPDGRPLASSGAITLENDFLSFHGPSSTFMHLPDAAGRVGLEHDQDVSSEDLPPPDLSTVNWQRHLPPEIPLTLGGHTELLNAFFSYYNEWCLYLDESQFLRGLCASASSALETHRNSHYSPLLHNVMMAMSVQLWPESLGENPTMTGHEAGTIFAQKARSYFELECNSPMISTVKGLMILASYHWSAKQLSFGWLFEGMGVRTAQTLGLNVEVSSLVTRGLISADSQAIRQKALYTVFAQDQLWALTIGRTCGMTMEDIEVPLPPIDADEDAVPWLTHEQRNLGLVVSAPLSWKSSTFHHCSKLMFIANRMHQALYRTRSQLEESTKRDLVSQLDLELNEWLLDLPSPLRLDITQDHPPPHLISLHAAFRFFQILLHRPTYTQPFSEDTHDRQVAVKTCNLAADEIVNLLAKFKQSPGLRYGSVTMAQTSFAAGTVYLLKAVRVESSSKEHQQAISQVKSCVTGLRGMCWPAANLSADILEQMLAEWSPDSVQKPVSVPASPMPSLSDLTDPNSDLAMLLRKLGWKPPTPTPPPESMNIGGLL